MSALAELLGWPGARVELHTALALAAAFLFGALIGFERQWRQRTAGLRTNVLVAVGAAAFADLGLRLRGVEGGTQIIAYVVSGIGFLGAGVILKDGAQIRGLNTAATLWCSAAVGAFCGGGLIVDAGLLTVAVLSSNTLLRPLVIWISRRPVEAGVTEAQYRVYVTCKPEHVSDVRDLIDAELAHANYPVREIEMVSEKRDQVEFAAALVPITADPVELDTVVAAIERSPLVSSATWAASTTS